MQTRHDRTSSFPRVSREFPQAKKTNPSKATNTQHFQRRGKNPMINRSAYGIQQSEIPRTELAIITVIYFIPPPPFLGGTSTRVPATNFDPVCHAWLMAVGCKPKKRPFQEVNFNIALAFLAARTCGTDLLFSGVGKKSSNQTRLWYIEGQMGKLLFFPMMLFYQKICFSSVSSGRTKRAFPDKSEMKVPPSANSLWFYEIWRAWEWSSHRCSSIIADFGRKPRLVSIDTRAALWNVLIWDVY